MSWLDKIWPKEAKVVPTTSLEVLLIEPDAAKMTVALGISKARAQELEDALKQLGGIKQKYTTTMAAMSKICKHPNELAFASYVLGFNIGYQEAAIKQFQF